MEPRKILIADPSEEIRTALEAALRSDFQVFTCATGPEALEILQSHCPDLLILELELPGLDGIGLLRKLAALSLHPKTLVYASAASGYISSVLQTLGIDYAVRKPTSIHIVAERTRELLAPPAEAPLNSAAADILIYLCIPYGTQGSRNLIAAITCLALYRDQSLSKELYPQVAAINRVTAASVEKSIRDAIHSGWARGERSRWQQFFPGITQCPSNREFLCRIADALSPRLRCS